MALTTSMACQSSVFRFNLKPSQRFRSNSLFKPISTLGVSKQSTGSGFLSTRGLNHFSTIKINRDFTVYSSVSPDGSDLNSMTGWLLGMVITIVLPLVTHKWGSLLKWTKNIESIVDTAEQIANTIELAAGKLHEVAENIEESLPQGNLRNAFDFIENTAEEIAKGADVVGDLIDKIQEIENKMDAFLEANETHEVAITTTTAESVTMDVETQKEEDLLVEPGTMVVEVNEVVKETDGQM